MRTTFLTFLVSLVMFQTAFAANTGKFDAFMKLGESQRAKSREEGLSYMVGGGAGLALSVALGINSKEALPKIGYSLIQVLSAAAIVNGSTLYYQGDGFTQEADRLRIFEQQLSSQKELSADQKKKILDETTAEVLRTEVQRYKQLRKIRGYLELATVASSGATLAFSQSKGSASSSALGFITLISLVGAYSDLFGSSDPASALELYSYGVPSGRALQLAWTARW